MSRQVATCRCRARVCLGFAGRRVHAIANPAGFIASSDTKTRLRGTRKARTALTGFAHNGAPRILCPFPVPHSPFPVPHSLLCHVRDAPKAHVRVPRRRRSCLGGWRKHEVLVAERTIPRRPMQTCGEGTANADEQRPSCGDGTLRSQSRLRNSPSGQAFVVARSAILHDLHVLHG